jgi:hypothetical protein
MIKEICGMTPEACVLRRKIALVETDDRTARLQRKVDDLDDLLSVDLA